MIESIDSELPEIRTVADRVIADVEVNQVIEALELDELEIVSDVVMNKLQRLQLFNLRNIVENLLVLNVVNNDVAEGEVLNIFNYHIFGSDEREQAITNDFVGMSASFLVVTNRLLRASEPYLCIFFCSFCDLKIRIS